MANLKVKKTGGHTNILGDARMKTQHLLVLPGTFSCCQTNAIFDSFSSFVLWINASWPSVIAAMRLTLSTSSSRQYSPWRLWSRSLDFAGTTSVGRGMSLILSSWSSQFLVSRFGFQGRESSPSCSTETPAKALVFAHSFFYLPQYLCNSPFTLFPFPCYPADARHRLVWLWAVHFFRICQQQQVTPVFVVASTEGSCMARFISIWFK